MALLHLLHDGVRAFAVQELAELYGELYKKFSITDLTMTEDHNDLYEGTPLTKIVVYLKAKKEKFTEDELKTLDELFPPEEGESLLSSEDEITTSHQFPLVHEVEEDEEFEQDEELETV